MAAELRALLLDFDGTMLETEGPSYESWRELLAEHGVPFALDAWASTVGTFNRVDPVRVLEQSLGRSLDGDALRRRRIARKLELVAAEALRPGIEELVLDARGRGVRTAIVTSASRAWALEHLERFGLHRGWDCIVAADGDPARAKPAPTVYLEALDALAIGPREAIAVEDSPNGVSAAKAAGIDVVAFPNPITRQLDLGAADAVVTSLDGMSLDDLLAALGRQEDPADA